MTRNLSHDHGDELARQVILRAPVGIFETDVSGECLEVNERWCAMTGLTREQARGRGWVPAIHPDDRDAVLREWNRSIQDGREFVLEYRYIAGDRVTWVLGHAVAVRDADGRVTRYVGTATDITRSKTAEEAASGSVLALRVLFDQLPEPVIVHHFGPIAYGNAAAAKALGYTLEELQSLSVSDVLHPSERERVQQRIDSLEQGRSTLNERRMTRMRRKDGRVSLFEVTAVRSEYEGKPVIIAMLHDVGAQLTREAHLRASLEGFTDAFFILECERDLGGAVEDFCITEANEALKRMIGKTTKVLVGERLSRALDSDTFGSLFQTYVHAHELAQPITQELELKHLNLWVHHQVLPLPNGVAATFHDVTDRRRSQELLRESEERWQFALEGANQGVWDWNVETGEVFFTKRFKSMLGYEEHEIGNRVEEWSSRVHPGDFPRVMEEVQRYFRGEAPVYETEHRMRCKDGSYLWILDRGGVTSWTPDHKPRRMVGTHTDITKFKENEELLRRSLAEKEVLLKEVHHRVKNNLQVISSLLRLQASKLVDPSARVVLRECQARIRSIALLHERLYQTADFSNVNLAEYTRGLVAELGRTLGSERIQVSVSAASVSVPLDIAIPYSLILNELVTNAFKHAFPDKTGRLEIGLAAAAGEAVLEVRDNGPGLPQNSTPEGSSSLGMTLIRSLANQLHGVLSLNSAGGAIAVLRFPCEAPPERLTAPG